jgi:hypothetical protein
VNATFKRRCYLLLVAVTVAILGIWALDHWNRSATIEMHRKKPGYQPALRPPSPPPAALAPATKLPEK